VVDAFLLLGEYLEPLDVLDAVRPVHRAWLATVADAGRLVLAGRRLSQDGSVVIVLAESQAEAVRLSMQDPYVVNGLARYDVVGFEAARWGTGPPTLPA
jgi:uncharacterized protein YciI